MKFYSDLSLTYKNVVSFGFILALMLVIVILAELAFSSIESGIDDYSEYAQDYAIASHLQENLLMMRMNVKDFLITNSDKDLKEFQEYSNKFDSALERAKTEINKPERVQKIKQIDQLISTYKNDFASVEDIILRRNDLIRNRYGKNAPEIRKLLSELIKTAYEDGDPQAAYVGDQAIQSLLLGRIYYTRYFTSSDQQDMSRGDEELRDKFQAAMQQLRQEIQNPGRIEIMAKIDIEYQQLLDSVDQIITAIQQRNDLVLKSLDVIGPEIASLGVQITDSVDADRSALRKELISRVQREKVVILVFAIVSIILGVFFTSIANRFVTGPIKKVSELARQIADGNLTVSAEVKSQDETGLLAKSLNETVSQLNKDMSQISDASRDLNQKFNELQTLSNETQHAMHNQQQIADTVATATLQMTTTTEQIAKSTVEATNAVETTLEKAKIGQQLMDKNIESVQTLDKNIIDTSKNIQQLEASSDEISGIVQVISGISDQTNLLALNAAIESARAGEHGRGFSVVADEVRSLAAKTQASTEEIQKIIDRLQSGTQSAVKDMQNSCQRASECVHQSKETHVALEEIAQSIDSLKGINIQVATATEQNSVVAQEVSRSIVEVKDSSSETLEGTLKSSRVNESIGVQASCLEELVSKFRLTA